MAQKDDNNKTTSQQQTSKAASVISEITRSRLLSVLLFLVVLVLITIIMLAFYQGRSISFWPPSIGELPTATTQPATPVVLTPTVDTTTTSSPTSVKTQNAQSTGSQVPSNLCNYYGIEISEPPGGYILENGQARISGTVTELPPYGSIRLMTIADSTPVSYWPQSLVTIDPSTKEWNGVIYSPYDTTAAVVILGDDGQILFDYFRKAADTATSQDAQYLGLTQLTKDVQTCKKVTVRQPLSPISVQTGSKSISVDSSLYPFASTGIFVKEGDTIEVQLQGPDQTWSCADGKFVGPEGTTERDKALSPSMPFCALIGSVGEAGPFYPIGTSNNPSFTASRSGLLYLGVNDIPPERCGLSDIQQCFKDNFGKLYVNVLVKSSEIIR